MSPTIEPTIRLRNEMKDKRLQWYRARETLQRIDEVAERFDTGKWEVTAEEWGVSQLFIAVDQWVMRLRPLDTVEEAYQGIWHERPIGPYEGLAEWDDEENHWDYREEGGGFRAEEVDIEAVIEAGKAAEMITVHGYDLPQQPPVDVEPIDPEVKRKEAKAAFEEFREEFGEVPEI